MTHNPSDECKTCGHIRAAHFLDHTEIYGKCLSEIFIEREHGKDYCYPCPCKEFVQAESK